MNLTVLSPFVLFAGIAVLAAGLYLIQRLRVRHQQLEVITTIFWREAIEEHNVSVFMRRFRHPWAYALLLAIASLLLLLVAGPRTDGTSGDRHVILLDGSAAMSREGRFDAAVTAARELAADLPEQRREIRLVADTVETILAEDESLPLFDQRISDRNALAAPGGFEPVLQSLCVALDDSAASGEQSRMHVYLVGDAPVRDALLERLPESMSVHRVPLAGELAKNHGVVALGVAEAASGAWETVDVVFEIAPAPSSVPASAVAVSLDGQPVTAAMERLDNGRFVLRDVNARGGLLSVTITDPTWAGSIAFDDTAALALPDRPRITVHTTPGVPEALRTALGFDPAVRLVNDAASAEVVIGDDAAADLQLTTDQAEVAFRVVTGAADAQADSIAEQLIDQLAIQQIDAAALAEAAGRPIQLEVVDGDKRHLEIWRALFEESYDFRESRSCPVFVARAVRWLSGRPQLLPWVAAGEPIVVADGGASKKYLDRAGRAGSFTTHGGVNVHAALLDSQLGAGAAPADADAVEATETAGLDLISLIGIVVAMMLLCEWVLYQRGRLP